MNNINNLIFYAEGKPSPQMENIRSPAALFLSFFSFFMIEELVTRTNERMVEERATLGPKNRYTATFRDTTFNEMKAFIATLIVSGCRGDSHLRTKHMFENLFSVSFYRLLFSEKRYAFILRSLRFDNKAARNGNDRFEYCRVIWDWLMDNCRSNWTAGPVVSVDEQLIPFRGHCVFRMYLPNKPAKYGLKIFMVCDSKSQYCIFGIPYLGKGSVNTRALPPGVTQGEHFMMRLIQEAGLVQPGRAVSSDNWFITRHGAQSLSSLGMHLVGTIKPKPYLPHESYCYNVVGEQECVALYDHDERISIVMKRKKGKKIVTVLSTLHNGHTYVEGLKTEAHMYYNATKGGVDGFDKIVALHSVHRKTYRWSMCVLFGMINIAVANGWIIFRSRRHQRTYDKYDYMQNLAIHLATDWANDRYHASRQVNPSQKETLKRYFNIVDWPQDQPQAGPPQQPQPGPSQQRQPSPSQQLPQPAPLDLAPVDVDHGLATMLRTLGMNKKKEDKKQRCRLDVKDVTTGKYPTYTGKACCQDCGLATCPLHSHLICRDCFERQQRWVLSPGFQMPQPTDQPADQTEDQPADQPEDQD